MDFSKVKKQRLDGEDLSRKGSIDEEIVTLCTFINDQNNYFTTSSCSGRIAIFSENEDSSKRGCRWLLICHNKVTFEQLKSCVFDKDLDNASAVFKFEPFVLHVQCRALEDAKLMHQVAVESGFRNSGITIGRNGKIMMAVRSTHGLEVPLANNGTVLVSTEYVKYIADIANSKMEENIRRIDRFFSNLKNAIKASMAENSTGTSKSKRKLQSRKHSDKKFGHKAVQCNLTCYTEPCSTTDQSDGSKRANCKDDIDRSEGACNNGRTATDDLDDVEFDFKILDITS